MARLNWLLVVLALGGCPKRVDPGPQVAPRAVRLLAETAERETTSLTELRPDLEFDTTSARAAYVVATGETPLLQAEGAQVRLYGDEAGTKGIEVDNCILIEVVSPDGAVLGRAVVGYTDGLIQGKEHIDSLGPRQFRFEAGEVSLEPILPERGPFKLRATVLDNGGVSRVSDVWVRLTPRASTRDELRE